MASFPAFRLCSQLFIPLSFNSVSFHNLTFAFLLSLRPLAYNVLSSLPSLFNLLRIRSTCSPTFLFLLSPIHSLVFKIRFTHLHLFLGRLLLHFLFSFMCEQGTIGHCPLVFFSLFIFSIFLSHLHWKLIRLSRLSP